MPQISYLPKSFPLDSGSNLMAGAKAYWYITLTTTPKDTYTDYALSVANTNPVVADGNGIFPTTFLKNDVRYRLTLKTSADVLIYTQDDIGGPVITQAELGAILYPRTAAELAAGVTPTNYAYAPGHVLRYGTNTTPGTTDMTAAFQNASLVSLVPYVPNDTFKITGTIQIRAGQCWRLDNPTLVITGNTVVFNSADGINDFRVFGGAIIQGDNTTGGGIAGTGKALNVAGGNRYYVENLSCKNIKGWGIYVAAGTFVDPLGDQGKFVACTADSCMTGFETIPGNAGEYCNFVGCNATRCGVGAALSAGNTVWSGGNIEGNTEGVNLSNGANSAHGMFVGVNINHNTVYNIHCAGVLNGHTFIGCHIYPLDAVGGGGIFLDQCKGIVFDGCVINGWIYNYKGGGSGLNVIRNPYVPSDYGLVRKPGSNNGHDELIIIGGFGAGILSLAGDALDVAGVSMNDAAFLHVVAKRANGSTQGLTTGVAADLLFNTEVFDRRGAYNPATGVTTIPATQGGMYRIQGDLIFSGTAMSTTASYVEIKINGAVQRLFTPTIFGTTKLNIQVNAEVYLNATDTIKLTGTITGTTPVHGDPTYESGLSIERIT